jgi:hypothetical protein
VELVSKRDEAVFLNTSPTVFFREFLVQNGLSCVFPPWGLFIWRENMKENRKEEKKWEKNLSFPI